MIRRVLVGLGDESYSASATETALDIAEAHQASLTGISVLDAVRIKATGPVPIGAGHLANELRQERFAEVKRIMQQVEMEFESACENANISHNVQHAEEEPFQCFSRLSRYHDMLVCGLAHLFEHGVVDEPPSELMKLVRSGVRPLVTVTKVYHPVRRVLIAYSGSIESAKAMKRFVQLRAWPDVDLQIVTFKDSREKATELLADAKAYCEAHGYKVDTEYQRDKAMYGLLPYAKDWEADMIVMGNCSRSLLVRSIFGETLLNTIKNTDRALFLAQ